MKKVFLTCCMIMSVSVPAQAAEEIIRVQLKPAQEARIKSPMSGEISDVLFKDGQHVQKGKTIISYKCDQQKMQLDQAMARVKKQSTLLKSARKLYELGGASETEIAVLQAEQEEARATRNLVKSRVKDCNIKAPFNGIISSLHVKKHFSVQEGEPMVELVGDAGLEIEMIVPSLWMRWLKKDTEFTLLIDETGQEYKSIITRLGGRVDPVTQSVKAYAALADNAHDLLPGMSGEAKFPERQEEVEANASKVIEGTD